MKNNVVIVGAQWGDEGKGKVVDLYSSQADYIVRFQGGNNAGHTLVVGGETTVLHLIPSGVLHPGKVCLIGNGVVFDPNIFFEEIESLQNANVLSKSAFESIQVSERAHVILPYHRKLDQLREQRAGSSKGKIGTTVRGIGPAYEDKVARRGIQVIDLLHPELLKETLKRSIEEKNILLKHLFQEETINLDKALNHALGMGEKLKPFISDVRVTLQNACNNKKSILFEGAQGALLDVDHGTYPYVTSSNTISSGALAGTGLGHQALNHVIGITKAYTTRVGTGPFPTEIENTECETAETIRKVGAEFGATTGRPRRTGWLDLVALKYSAQINGMTGLALMKSDVLNGFNEVKLCTSYNIHGKNTQEFSACIEDLEKVTPVYESTPGWGQFDTQTVRSRDQLPKEMLEYIEKIESFVGVPIVLLSIGPGREETIQFLNPFERSTIA